MSKMNERRVEGFRSRAGLALVVVLLAGCGKEQDTFEAARDIPAPQVIQQADVAEGEFDKYGGYTAVKFSASGRFRVEKKEGNWWFVTPDGNGFFSHGVQGVTSYAEADENWRFPYRENIIARYGNLDTWVEKTTELIRYAGLNTIGDFSEPQRFNQALPYVRGVKFRRHAPPIQGSPGGFKGAAVDFFDPAFEKRADENMEVIAQCGADPYCVGVFTGDEYPWATNFLQPIPMFDAYQFLPADAPGKKALQHFLEARYSNDIAAFNKVWDTAFAHFDELQNVTVVRPDPGARPGYYEGALGGSYDIKGLGGKKVSVDFSDDPFGHWRGAPEAQNADRFAFRGYAAERFYKVIAQVFDKASPDTLNLCARFLPTNPTVEVVQAAARYCDVISINAFEVPTRTIKGVPLLGIPGMYKIWAEWTQAFVADPAEVEDEDFRFYPVWKISELVDKPILLSSFSYRAEIEGMNDFPPTQIFAILDSQEERADKYEGYVREALTIPSVVGAHWFIHSDQVATGRRGDGEDSNFGIVSITDEPYMELVDRMKKVTSQTFTIRSQAR